MIEPSMDALEQKADCKFTLVMEVAKRARDLVKGYRPLVSDAATNPVSTAIIRSITGGQRSNAQGVGTCMLMF